MEWVMMVNFYFLLWMIRWMEKIMANGWRIHVLCLGGNLKIGKESMAF